ncbi:hypothetical protein VPNG_03592 [Cytospora leucostoma]|uniref:Uncharacterized protein n=1 Tax=Cytospora leucostoma TaxID=1230097 RepID=A0A423XD55_9PEZI|nr:hypothetical protein VPNG_03592 [Cytospora leucostoma]
MVSTTLATTASGDNVQHAVHLGTWTNWAHGPILGVTLTLESRYGLLLLSFTATFVAFVASRSWRIITLIFHRFYSTPEPRDALHHQRQVVLRNSSSAATTFWTTIQLAWAWRGEANRYISRTLPTILSAALAFCAFTVAGGFTSSISSSIGNDVLLDGHQCGKVNGSALNIDTLSVIYPWVSQNMNNAANYAQQCYSENATGVLDWDICRSKDSNLLLDSGLISSDDFGMNLPSSQRMYYREVLQCAPLRTNGFVTSASTTFDNYTRYWYGTFGPYNWTYEVEDLDAQYGRQSDNPVRANGNGLKLITLQALTANGTAWIGPSDIVPIPELLPSDGDLLIVFLSGYGTYFLGQGEDPWYRAFVPSTPLHLAGGVRTLYTPEDAASPLGCVERYQYCNSNRICGNLTSFADALTSALPLFHEVTGDVWSGVARNHTLDAVANRFNVFQNILQSSSDLYDLLNALGSSSLLSQQHLAQGFMGWLPENQWKLDATHWFSMRMASLQAAFVNYAHGPTDESLLPYIEWPANKYARTICSNQKILSTDYTSLSLFGLYFTYITGLLIIVISYIIEPVLSILHARKRYEEYKFLEWSADATLQLQRLAYQGLGSERWSNYTDTIPKTRPAYFLADLALAYPQGRSDAGEGETKRPAQTTDDGSTVSASDASHGTQDLDLSHRTPQPVSSPPSGPLPRTVSPTARRPDPVDEVSPIDYVD